jgi:hypothetical protein
MVNCSPSTTQRNFPVHLIVRAHKFTFWLYNRFFAKFGITFADGRTSHWIKRFRTSNAREGALNKEAAGVEPEGGSDDFGGASADDTGAETR